MPIVLRLALVPLLVFIGINALYRFALWRGIIDEDEYWREWDERE